MSIRCDKCGEWWWDAHACPMQMVQSKVDPFPPRPPGYNLPTETPPQLERWGRSEDPQYLLQRRDDGYWTPWHIAEAKVSERAAEQPADDAPTITSMPFGEAKKIILAMNPDDARGMAISLLTQQRSVAKFAEYIAERAAEQPVEDERSAFEAWVVRANGDPESDAMWAAWSARAALSKRRSKS